MGTMVGIIVGLIAIPIIMFVGCSACAGFLIGIGEAELQRIEALDTNTRAGPGLTYHNTNDTHQAIEFDYDQLELGRREGYEDYKTPHQNPSSERCEALAKLAGLTDYTCD